MQQTIEQQVGRGVRLIRPVEVVTLTLDEFIKGKYNTTRDTFSRRVEMLLGRIEKYIETMHARAINTPESITKQQSAFLQTVLGILDSEPQDALLCWDILMFLAAKHEPELFNDRMACRFYNNLPVAQQQPFLSLMTLVVNTANIRNRATYLRTCNLATITPQLSSERQRSNLAAYYAANL